MKSSSNSYKKRAKGNWNQGKRYKGDDAERAFAKMEIARALSESEELYRDPYKKSQRKRNDRARLEHRINWYESTIEKWGRIDSNSSFRNSLRESLREAKKEYKEKFGEEK